MTDIARLGFSADTTALKEASADLKAIIPVAEKVEKAAEEVGASLTNAANSASKAGASFDRAASGASNEAAALNKIVGSSNAATSSVTRLAEGYDILTGKMNGNFLAIGNNLQRLGLLNNKLNDTGKAMKFTAIESLNLSRQLADIGVTAAMGMNPLMIAIQQGPQLFDILQNKAAMTGQTIGQVSKQAGAQMMAAFRPVAPMLLGIAAAAGAVAAAFGLATRAINSGSGDLSKGLGLTEKQLKRVEEAGVSTSVTLGDTFAATFEVLGSRLYETFEGPLTWLGEKWNDVMDFLTETGGNAIKFFIGVNTGAVKAVMAAWKLLPGAIGDVVIQLANLTLRGIQDLINGTINGINMLIGFVNGALGMDISSIQNVDLGQFQNQFAGQGKAFGEALMQGFNEGMQSGMAAVDRFFADVAAAARARREKAIKEAAGDAEKGSKRGGKTNAEKFSDLVGDVTRDIAMTEAKIKGLDMSADAALRLENQQKLLNDAQAKGIVLTDKQRQVLMGLADELTDAQIKLKNLEGFKKISEAADAQLKSLEQAGERIGKYGEELAILTAQQELYNAAVAAGITLDEKQKAALEGKAAQIGAQEFANKRNQALEDMAKQAEDDQFNMERERQELYLTGEALEAFRYETELLNQARAAGIADDPAVIAGIKETAEAYGKMRHEINVTRDALDFAKGSVKGFFTDMISNLRQGQSVWQAFGNAVMNVLNKLIDKLLDSALDAALNSISFGGSVKPNAKGNVFGSPFDPSRGGGIFETRPELYAKGGTFTNGIVSSPTLFKFANGGALGMMGEAGPEAIMPLERGPDGTLGVHMFGAGAGGGGGAVQITVAAEEGAMFIPRIKAISEDVAVNVTQAGIAMYNEQMPERVQQIANDERAR